MTVKRSSRGVLLTLGLGMALVVALPGVASAGKTAPPSPATVTWTGNGSVVTESIRTLNTEQCDEFDTPYLLWVLSGSKATSASISIPGESTEPMDKPQIDKKGFSTFKYTWSPDTAIDLDELFQAVVTATYNDAKNKATLTVSHGCLGGGGEAASLTVHLIGEFKYGDPSQWVTLGSQFGGTNTTLKVCETGLTTGCADFASGALPGSTRTITLSSADKALDVTVTDDYDCSTAYVLLSDIAVADNFAGSSESGVSFTSTSTFSNGGDVWVVVECGG